MPSLEHFAAPMALTDLTRHADLVDALPRDPAALVPVVQGLLVHAHWRERHGLPVDTARDSELQLRRADAMLARALELDARPLVDARPPERRVLGVCRHFAVLVCAFLRAQGVPARARCGFANYFEPQRWLDHWVCEIWDEISAVWKMVDAQLDVVQRSACKIDFDPLDVPRTRFLVAGEAWQRCRAGELDPERFGIFDLSGTFFIAGNVLRDLAAFAKLELLPWDVWSPMWNASETPDPALLSLMDQAAAALTTDDAAGMSARSFYAEHPALQVPGRVRAVFPAPHDVDLAAQLR
jgi:Transglutaminase-like superfamily